MANLPQTGTFEDNWWISCI